MCPVEEIERLRGIGSQHFKEQNLNEARKVYLEIGDILKTLSDDVIIEQKYYQFYSNLALVDYQLRNFEDAIKFSTLCIKYVELASADFVKGHYYLIRTLYALGQEFEARELLEKARKQYPDQPTLKALKLSKNESEFEIESLLGEGNFTQVLRVTEKTLNKKFAMKIAQRQHLTSKGYWEAIYMEKHCLNRLIGSPYFNRLYWHFENGASVYLCLDYGPQIELWAFLHLSGLVDLNFGASLFLQIRSALEYVHDHDIVHRDLKCENIMLSGNRQIKLIDFGTARDLSRPDMPTFISTGRIRHEQRQKQMQKLGKSSDTLPFEHYVGTPQFMPPESIQNEINDKLSDLWSLGCLYFQMLSGYPPFHAASEYLIFQKIMPDKVWNSKLLMASYTPKLEWGIGVDPLAQDLVSQLVRPNRADRLPLAEIPKHKFFQQTRTKRSPYTLAQLCLSHCSQCYQPYESKPKLGGWIGDISELVIDDIDKYTFLSTASKNGLHRIHFSQLYFRRNRQKDPADDGWTVLN